MGGNTCSSSSGTAKNQRHGAFPAECRRYLDGFFVANVRKGWNMQKQKLHLESKVACVFVHIILPRYFVRKNSGWVLGLGVPFVFFSLLRLYGGPTHANPLQLVDFETFIRQESTAQRSMAACGFTFLVGVHEEKTGRARKAQVWVPLQGFRFVGSQESRKQVKSENLKIHWNIIRGLF